MGQTDEKKLIEMIDQFNKTVRLRNYQTMKLDYIFSVGDKRYGVLGVIVLCDRNRFPGNEYTVSSGGLNWQYLSIRYLLDCQETDTILQNRFGLWQRNSRMAFIREWNKFIYKRERMSNLIETFCLWPS